MARAMLRTFRDRRVGQVDLELAPVGMLLVIAFGDPYGMGLGDGPLVAAPRGSHRSLADAATLLGYADHPHLCHETRRLAGRTPAQLLGRDVDAPDADQVT
jgi:AraC-like DNA-binding protein